MATGFVEAGAAPGGTGASGGRAAVSAPRRGAPSVRARQEEKFSAQILSSN